MQVLCFEIEYIGFMSKWRLLAKDGKKIEAIKELRHFKQKHGDENFGLKEAKDQVEAYMSLKNYQTKW